ncbi:uncharacterized protein LOC142163296 [Nicotiana tabacum]|uniref:Uncharacterized protein LOC142163296 n=1 Tax=Nicotiana tabacum TaxID=4097 RepID=A0AC58RVB6_TOBAC
MKQDEDHRERIDRNGKTQFKRNWLHLKNRSLNGLKQPTPVQYDRLSKYFLKEGYKNDPICPCVFIKRSKSEFVIIVVYLIVYVDNLNIIGSSKELPKDVECLKKEFEMKYLAYLANNTQPDITFAGTIDMRLFYSNKSKLAMIGCADASYLSDPHKAQSQIGYLFTYGGTTISLRSMKQTIASTSSNHVGIVAIHEASQECIWLRSTTQHIQEMCDFPMKKYNPTTLYEDNDACIAQLKGGYIKGDQTKYF